MMSTAAMNFIRAYGSGPITASLNNIEINPKDMTQIGISLFVYFAACFGIYTYGREMRLETAKNLATARAIHETLEGIHAADAKQQQAIKDEHDRKAILESGKSLPQ